MDYMVRNRKTRKKNIKSITEFQSNWANLSVKIMPSCVYREAEREGGVRKLPVDKIS